MKNKLYFFSLLSVSLIFLTLFKSWFIGREIIGGDWPYFFNETLKEFTLFPPAWSVVHGNGLGGTINTYFLDQYLYSIVFVFTNTLQMPWTFIYKIFWFGLFVALSISSSIYLLKTIFSQAKSWQMLLTALIFTTNTYILMVVGGGQMGIALAYATTPLVLARFLIIVQSSKFKVQSSLVAGLVLAIQVMFDPRIAYVAMGSVALYYIVQYRWSARGLFWVFVIPGVVVVLLNGFWLLPLLVLRNYPLVQLGSAYTSIGSVKFFSFADFSHALALLQPNWPENLFGKTYFLQPEFLVLPILAFTALLFIKKLRVTSDGLKIINAQHTTGNDITILYFAMLALVGVFLAKGANPPGAGVFIWMFEHVPGFVMFRDPTKFYILIVISYSVLIPYSLNNFIDRVTVLNKKIVWLPVIAFIIYWVITIRPAVMGNLGGTFVDRRVPEEYIQLKDWLVAQKTFFRTLWVPRQHRFAFVSQLHPSIEAGPLLGATDSASLVKVFSQSDTPRQLEYLGIQYIVVSYDVYGEIFQEDRRYSPAKRAYVEQALDSIAWLKKVKTGEVTVYKTPVAKDHFWTKDGKGMVTWNMLSGDRYMVDVSLNAPGELMFSEAFHSGWRASTGDKSIPAQEAEYGMMSFALPKGTYTAEIEFTPGGIYLIGRVVSLTTMFVVSLYLVIQSIIKRKKPL